MACANANSARLGEAAYAGSICPRGNADAVQGFHHFQADRRARQRHLRHVRLRPPAHAGRRYDDELLALYGLADAGHLLPRLADPTEVVGRVTANAAAQTGLAEGTPVIAGLFRCHRERHWVRCGRVGRCIHHRGHLVHQSGVFRNRGQGPERLHGRQLRRQAASSRSSRAPPPPPIWNGMCANSLSAWRAITTNPFALCNDLVAAIQPAADDPLFHPFLYGSRLGAECRAGFYGLAGWHGEGHLLRALFEGVMFEHRRHIDVLAKAGLSIRRAVLSGGGSRSPHWPQMFADGLGVPIATAEARETGALGAAIGAGVGAGLFDRLRNRHRGDDAAARHIHARSRDAYALRPALRSVRPSAARPCAASGPICGKRRRRDEIGMPRKPRSMEIMTTSSSARVPRVACWPTA